MTYPKDPKYKDIKSFILDNSKKQLDSSLIKHIIFDDTNQDTDDKITSINKKAYSYCMNLESINFSKAKSLTTICDGAFYNCYLLETVILPDQSIDIEADAFSKHTETIKFYNTNEEPHIKSKELNNGNEVKKSGGGIKPKKTYKKRQTKRKRQTRKRN